jgi:hypothetical protein
MQQLVERLEALGGLRAEERVGLAEWVEEGRGVGLVPRAAEWEWFAAGAAGGEAGGGEEAVGVGGGVGSREEQVEREEGGVRWGVRERAIGWYVRLGSRLDLRSAAYRD